MGCAEGRGMGAWGGVLGFTPHAIQGFQLQSAVTSCIT